MPNKEQEGLLAKTFSCVCFGYNKMLVECKETYEKFKDNSEIRKKTIVSKFFKIQKGISILKRSEFTRFNKRTNQLANGL